MWGLRAVAVLAWTFLSSRGQPALSLRLGANATRTKIYCMQHCNIMISSHLHYTIFLSTRRTMCAIRQPSVIAEGFHPLEGYHVEYVRDERMDSVTLSRRYARSHADVLAARAALLDSTDGPLRAPTEHADVVATLCATERYPSVPIFWAV